MVLIVTFLLAFFFALQSENSLGKQKEKYGIISLTWLFLASAFRYYQCEGFDYEIYEGWYKYIPKLQNTSFTDTFYLSYEAGYYYIMSFFKTLGISFYGFCVILAAFFYTALWKGLKKYTDHYGLLTLVFAYKLLFYDTHISMRQPITIAGFFLLLPLLQERKWIKYFLWTFVLTRFHNGAYILFPLYFITYLNVTKSIFRWAYIIFVPTIIIGFSGIDILGPVGEFIASNADSQMAVTKADKYFGNDNVSAVSIIHTLEFFVFSYFVYVNYDKLNFYDPKKQLIIKMFLCLLPLFTLFRGSEVLSREKDYFILSYAVLTGYIVETPTCLNRNLIKNFVIALCVFGYFRYIAAFNNYLLIRTYQLWPLVDGCSFFE